MHMESQCDESLEQSKVSKSMAIHRVMTEEEEELDDDASCETSKQGF